MIIALLYRLALFVFPPSFRRRYGWQMRRDLEELLARREPVAGVFLDVALTAPSEWWRVIRSSVSDLGGALAQAVRRQARQPGLTIGVLTTVAASTAMLTAGFATVDRVLLRDPHYAAPDRLVDLTEEVPATAPGGRWTLSAGNYMDYADGLEGLDGLAAYAVSGASLDIGAGAPVPLRTVEATANLLDVLGVRVALGTGFTPGSDGEVLLTHGGWTIHYGADPTVVGTTVRIDGRSRRVTGVLPQGVDVPHYVEGIDAVVPIVFTEADRGRRGGYRLFGVGRMQAGVTLDDLRLGASAVFNDIEIRHPRESRGRRPRLAHLAEVERAGIRPVLLVLFGGVAFLTVVAGFGLANLLHLGFRERLGRAAIQEVLGATRRRVVLEALLEVAVIAALGAALGLLLSELLLDGVAPVLPPWPPSLRAVDLSWRAALVGYAGAALVTLAAAAPSLLRFVLRGSGRSPTWGGGGNRVLGSTVRDHRVRLLGSAVQVTLAAALLVGSVLTIRSALMILSEDLGFDPDRLLSVVLPTAAGSGFPGDYADLLDRVESLPGVEHAAIADAVGRPHEWIRLHTSGGGSDHDMQGALHRVGPGYFDAMGIGIVEGRAFGPDDVGVETRVALITAEAAARLFPGESPVGRTIDLTPVGGAVEGGMGVRQIIGVTASFREFGAQANRSYPVFVPHGGGGGRSTIVVRAEGDPALLAPGVVSIVSEWAPEAPRSEPVLVADTLRRGRATNDLILALLAIFAGVTLLLATVNVFAVMAFWVGQRRRELALRAALGARPERLLASVMGQAVSVTAAAGAVGLVAGVSLVGLLPEPQGAALLYGVTTHDPVTLIGVFGGLVLLSAIAALPPARRAAGTDPMESLRAG